jgi:hypothetical protein
VQRAGDVEPEALGRADDDRKAAHRSLIEDTSSSTNNEQPSAGHSQDL